MKKLGVLFIKGGGRKAKRLLIRNYPEGPE